MTTNDQSHPLRIFLCHSAKDKAAVRQLYARLQQDNYEAWLDEEDLIAGQNWEIEIPKAVRRADIVLVCLSANAINSAGFVHKEIKFALDVADIQPEGTIFIIPLMLEDYAMPERLAKLHRVNYYEERGYQRLKRALDYRATSLGLTSVPAVIPSKPAPAPAIDGLFKPLERAETNRDWDKVIELGELILALIPDHEKTRTKTQAAYNNRGYAYKALNNKAAARPDFERADALGYEAAKQALRNL